MSSRISFFVAFCLSLAISLAGALTTNAIPPKVEADYLHSHYGLQRAIDYLVKDASSSVFYNTMLVHSLSVTNYYLIIFVAIMIIMAGLIFIPAATNRKRL